MSLLASVRVATSDDLDAVARLGMYVQQLHFDEQPTMFNAPDFDALRAHFANCLERESVKFLVATNADARVVGYALVDEVKIEPNAFKPVATIFKLDQIAVDPNFQRQGFARALVDEAVRLAERAGGSEVRLDVWKFNERAVDLYEQMGFVAMKSHMSRVL